ncbi:hypothetical protein AeMF1_015752 [Aphanomyces euteiches]|nr:hypothetical protein AeMF1_015752 [Aphanomyces euteiches]
MIKPNPRFGVICCVITNLIWGVCPIYWKQITQAPYLQLLCHRIVWALPTLLIFLTATCQIQKLWTALCDWKLVLRYAISGIMLGATLFLTVWAVNSGHIVEMSLAFFINPLFNVLLGVVYLRETLRRWQWVSVACAAVGVLVVAISYGQVPWIALGIALNFSVYGLVKKLAPLDSVTGVTIELTLLFIPAIIYLNTCHHKVFGHLDTKTDLLLVGAGIFPTAIPYVLFSASAQHISMLLLGVLQYIQPTGHFLIGVFMYNEPFSTYKLIGFVIVWVALGMFTVESIVYHRQKASTPPISPSSNSAAEFVQFDDGAMKSPQAKYNASVSPNVIKTV